MRQQFDPEYLAEIERKKRRNNVIALLVIGAFVALSLVALPYIEESNRQRRAENVAKAKEERERQKRQEPAPHTPQKAVPTYTPQPAKSCCKTCTHGKSKACGDTCISIDKACHKGAGCACNG